MIEKKIDICIGTSRDRNFRVRLSLLVIEGNAVFSEQYHSISISPGDDLTALKAINDTALQDANSGIPGAPWPPIPDDLWSDVEACVNVIHKPEIVAAFRAKQSDANSIESKILGAVNHDRTSEVTS